MTRMLRLSAALVAFAAAAPAVAATPPSLYMRELFTLSPDAPTAPKPLTNASVRIPAGQTALVGQFLTEPMGEEQTAGSAYASLFLVSGRGGMPECADITVETFRKTSLDERIVTGTETVQDTVVPKRKLTEPLIVPVEITDGVLAEPGDRLGVAVIVTNRCTRQKGVTLYYNAGIFPSGVVFSDAPTTTTTTTVTSTTTTTTDGGGSTTTTTIIPNQPVPASCLVEPQTGYNEIRCQIDTMDVITRSQPWTGLHGRVARKRLLVRLSRARAWLDTASVRHDPRPALAQVMVKLNRYGRIAKRSIAAGRLDATVGGQLIDMQINAFSQTRAMRQAATK